MTVEEAIQVAMEKVKSLFGGRDHQLEELSLHDDGDFVVTISYRGNQNPGFVAIGRESITSELFPGRKAAIGIDASRTYKDVWVSKDGHVKRVAMRHIVVG
jgi:hypothetical protein